MKKLAGIVFSIFLSSLLMGQKYDTVAVKFAQTITAEELKEHLGIIASDEFEGRETAKKGQKMAMEYLIKEFKSQGIKDELNVEYIQSYPLIEQEPKGIKLKIGDENYELHESFSIRPSIIKNQSISGELVFVGYGIEEKGYSDYEGIEVEGKAVFIWNGKPEAELNEKWSPNEKIKLAKSKGASAIFYYSKSLAGSLKKYKRYYNKPKLALEESMKEGAPIIALTQEPVDAYLKNGKSSIEKLDKKGVKKKGFSSTFSLEINKPTERLSGENVIAYIPGEEQEDEVVILTAHYDHIGMSDDEINNGADDDGTGTVSLLEICEAFQTAVKEGIRPKRSILIMPVSGEEKGLLGSKYYSDNPIIPLENTVANLNIDMIGRYDENHEKGEDYIYLIGSDRLSKELHNLSEGVNELYTQLDLDYTFNAEDDPNRFYYRSDHYNFAKNDIPVIFYFSGVHQDYHRPTDTAEKIDYEKTEKVARLIFLTTWHLANREERIQLD